MLQRALLARAVVYRLRWPILLPCSHTPSQKVRIQVYQIPYLLLISDPILGLFAGLSLEGTVLIERKDANREFYGSPVPARDILGGRVPPPEVASRLYEIIEAAEGFDETGLPESGYVPSTTGEHMSMRDNQMVFDADSHP